MSSRPRVAALLVALAFVAGAGCGDDTAAPVASASTTAASTAASQADADAGADAGSSDAPARLSLRIVARHPHDPAAFTEGLTFTDDGSLFESLGLDGASSVRQVDPATGAVMAETKLPADQFGEGLALGPGGLVQLTWKNGVAHRWDARTLTPNGPDAIYEGEGWGLTFDGERFVQSDGSPTLTRRDPATFAPVSTVEVRRGGAPVEEVNELEFVDGSIWANVWHSDDILRIDPATGEVTGVVDASSLWTDASRTAEMTLNGIAHRPGDPANRLWVTGKNWPELFEIEVSS